jgi:hypothetical protein
VGGGCEDSGRETGMYSGSKNQPWIPAGERLKKCATTGLMSHRSGIYDTWSGFSLCFKTSLIFNTCLSVLGSPSRVRVCCAACGGSEPSEKTCFWNSGACTLLVLLFFNGFCSV